MFCHIFKKSKEFSPQFEINSIPFQMHYNHPFVSIIYHGRSISDDLFQVILVINGNATKFLYSFSLSSPNFEIPIEDFDLEKSSLRIELEINCIDLKDNLTDSPFVGLDNFGATCYINTFLQTLYFIRPFKESVFKSNGYYSRPLQRLFFSLDVINSNKLQNETVEYINEDSYNNNLVLRERLSHFIRNISFVDCIDQHQDIHEFSKFLLDNLENENKESIKDLIEGRMVCICKCDCGCITKKYDPFQDLQMIVKDFYENKTISSLIDSLKEFCREVPIEGFKCEKHGPVNAKRSVLFDKLPKALFFLISRFCEDWESNRYIKINSKYEFPKTLDFSQFMDEDAAEYDNISIKVSDYESKKQKKSSVSYSLFSIMIHSGDVRKGHYYCYINLNGKYYKFNDNQVYECSEHEGIGWNYGGKYSSANNDKPFSAYYLAYIKSNSFDNAINFNLDNLISQSQRNFLKSSLQQKIIKYISHSEVLGYMGPGRYNLYNYSYPITPKKLITSIELSNISKLFPRKIIYNQDFKKIKEQEAEDDVVYYITNTQIPNKKLVFIKIFNQSTWCNYPTNLFSLGEKYVKDLDDFKNFTDLPDFDIFNDNTFDIVKVDNFNQINEGDSIVLVQKEAKFEEFMERLKNYQLVNIYFNEQTIIPIFVEKDLNFSDLLSSIHNHFHSTEIYIVYDPEKPLLDDCNRVKCKIESGNLFHVGISTDSFDINHIDHIHQFILPEDSKVSDLLKSFRLSSFICMSGLQYQEDLEVLETIKNSVNARIMDNSSVLESNNCFFVIQKKIKNPIRLCFYRNSYELLNYPFFIENPGSIKDLRDKYFFLNRIVKFNGSSYIECLLNDLIDLNHSDILLIESD